MMGLMVVMLTIGLGMLGLSETQSKAIVDDGKRLAAVGVAEAGIERIIWRLRQPSDGGANYGPFWRDLADERDIPLNGGSYYLAAMDETIAGVRGFRMQGWIPSRTAAKAVNTEIYVEVAPIYFKPWSGAALGEVGVPVANGGTDSYKSTEGPYGIGPVYQNGDVATNNTAPGSISVGNNGSIQGKAYYPRGGDPNIVSDSGVITGGSAPNPADTEFVDMPPPPADAIYLQPIEGNIVKTVSGTILGQPLSPGTYVIRANGNKKSITLKGSETLTVATAGQTVIYLQGDAEIGGNGIANPSASPPNLILYGMKANPTASPPYPGCQYIDFGGNGRFYGAVYAPEADISLNGAGSNGEVFGSLAGERVTFNGNGTVIHYDESLREMDGVIRAYRLHTWTQVK